MRVSSLEVAQQVRVEAVDVRVGFLLRAFEAEAQRLRQFRVEFGQHVQWQELVYPADFDLPLAGEIQQGLEIAQDSTARLVFANRLLPENLPVFS